MRALAALLLAAPMLLALACVALGWLAVDGETADYVWRNAIPRVAPTTLVLALVVPALAALLGVGAAWLTAVHDFPGRRWLHVALIVPLAIPAYLLATVYIGWLDYAGPVQTLGRSLLGSGFALPPIRSTGGAALTLALALYPYVYLLAHSAFASQGRRCLEVVQSLGMTRRQALWRVALPMARPWLAGGMLLVMMETVADFGAVAAFNVDTFTVAIYQTWFALFSISGALSLASVLVVIAVLVAALERRQRAARAYAGDLSPVRHRIALHGRRAWLASGTLGLLVLVAAVAPTLQLLAWAIKHAADFDGRYWRFAANSLSLAAMATAVLVAGATTLAWAQRGGGHLPRLAARAAQSGYALPGAVLAVALFWPLARLSGWVNALTPAHWPTLLLHTSLLTLLLAYGARFMAVASQPVESAFLRITPAVEDAARSLGLRGAALWRLVHLPMVRSGLLTAAVLVFIDVMKELPMTLMTRPYGWDTLAVRVFEMTAEGEWERAAVPGIGIVLLGLLPIAWLVNLGERPAHLSADHHAA